MYLSLLVLPLSTFVCLGLFGRSIGARGAIVLSIFSASVIACLSALIFYEVALCGSPCVLSCAPYFKCGLFDACWGFLFDTLTAVMCLVVCLISCLVIIYSCSYMITDAHFIRFMSYLKLFTVAMLILVTADNFVQLFVGWELVGLASFLLISFWFNRLQASKAAIQAMLLNRVGDMGLALGIMTLYFCYKTTSYEALFCLQQGGADSSILSFHLGGFRFGLLDFACILLFIGAMGKSGQFGLHAWLPNAMNAPTPVSALLHAATMVVCCHMLSKESKVKSVICWKNQSTVATKIIEIAGKTMVNQPETLLKRGSPEIVCRRTQECFHITNKKQSNDADENFLIWFIGFMEGDGSFIIGQRGLHFEITQSYYDIDLLYKISHKLGFGKVMKRQSIILDNGVTRLRHVGVYYVTGKTNFLKLIKLVNGRLLTSAKQVQFKAWLNRFNKIYGYKCDAKHVMSAAKISFDNAWLAGFIDAEGCFTARLRRCHTSKRGVVLLKSHQMFCMLLKAYFHLVQSTNILAMIHRGMVIGFIWAIGNNCNRS